MSEIMRITGGADICTFVTPEGEEKKTEALELASAVTAVSNEPQAELAAQAMRDLQEIIRLAEKSRVAIKEKPMALCRLIDKMAGDFSAGLEQEMARIKGLVQAYKMKQLEAQRKAEAEQRDKQRQIELERQRALEEVRKAEREADAAARKEAVQKANLLVQQKKEVAAAPLPVVTKQAGTAAKAVWKFEVVDIEQVFKARPDFVVLSPNNAVIRDAIRAGHRDCPGLMIWEEMSVSVR